MRAALVGIGGYQRQMRIVKHPFFVEFIPESVEELRTARKVFDNKADNRSVFAVAAADWEQDDVIAKYDAAMQSR